MKKKFFPVALMALAIGFNACSSDDVVNTNGDVVSGNVAVLEGGYVKMAINMPSQPSGRASNSNNDNFDDGLPKEFEVKDATLILFAGDGANEDEAIFHSAYNLDKISLAKEGAQITSTMRIVKPVNSDDYKDKNTLYAYVILNKNNCVTLGSTATDLKLNLKLPSSPTTPTPTIPTSMTGVKFGQFRQALVEGGESDLKNNGFLMNNAPLSRTADSQEYYQGEVKTLVKIDGHVYKTKAEADASDANEIFVERALAKVTMQYNNKTGELSAADATIYGKKSNKVAYEIKGWALNVTNKKSFLGRDYDAAWNGTKLTISGNASYRFVGSTALRKSDKPDYAQPGEGSALYRTYWGKDPNYESYDDQTDFTCLKKTDSEEKVAKDFGNYHPLYCMENTLDVAQMEEGSQVTRAIVKVQFNGGKTFYTFNDDNTTLYNKEDMENRVKQAILDNTDVFKECETSFPGKTLGTGNVTIIWDSADGTPKRDGDGKIYLKSFEISDGTTTVKSSTVFAGVTDLNSKLQFSKIMQYADGLAYYSIPIKHFGDNLTPWDKTKATVRNPYGDTSTEESKNSYLGRYGVLRNNWYDISISAIRNVGSPVIPEITFGPGNTPDEVENYIAVRINVLSWAKRTQEEIL